MAISQKVPRDKRHSIRDAKLPGFVKRVGPRGTVYYFETKPRGFGAHGKRLPTSPIRIGDDRSHSEPEARAEARKLRAAAMAGEDPAQKRRAAHEEARAKRLAERPAREVIEAYAAALNRDGKGEKHASGELAQVRLALRSVGAEDRALDWFNTKQRVLEVQDKCPHGSRRARFGAVDRFLRWSAGRGYVGIAATTLIDRAERAAPPRARDRVLTLKELALIWRAIERVDTGDSVHDLLRFMIAVPARRNEIARARFDQFEPTGRVWNQPSTITKNKNPHAMPLNRSAWEILERCHRGPKKADAGGLCFPAPRSGGVFNGFSNLKEALDKRIADLNGGVAIAACRFHDLRRTFATQCAEHGVDETVCDLILNHVAAGSRGGVRGVYQRAARWNEKLAAIDVWQRVLYGFVDTHNADVIPLPRRKRR
jgi:integrase